MAFRSMRQDAVFPGLPESLMAYDEDQGRGGDSRGLSAARGILIGLGIAGLMWMLLVTGVIHIFFR